MVAPASRYRPSCCSGDSGSRGLAALTGVIDRGQTGRSRIVAYMSRMALSKGRAEPGLRVEVGGEREHHLGLIVDSIVDVDRGVGRSAMSLTSRM